MNDNFSTIIKSKTKVFHWSISIFVFTIPVSSLISVKLLLVTLLISFFVPKRVDFSVHFFRQTWSEFLYFLIILIGVFYSKDTTSGFKVLETSFSFIAVPIIFSSPNFHHEGKLNEIVYSFILGLAFACAICVVNAAIVYSDSGDAQAFFFDKLTDVIHSQPTYLAYYLIFAITLGLYLSYYKKNTIKPVVLILLLAFFFIMLILTGGQTAFVSMLLIFSFFILKFLVDQKTHATKLTFAIVLVMLTCMFIVSAAERISRGVMLTDSWERFALWESAIKANSSVVWGVGTGGDREILNNYYKSHNLSFFASDNYNAHNQFIQILLTNGILGVFSVLVLICRPIYLSVKNQNVMGTLVLFPFLIYGMTEVFLGRYQGVIFFALTHQIFISYYLPGKTQLETSGKFQ